MVWHNRGTDTHRNRTRFRHNTPFPSTTTASSTPKRTIKKQNSQTAHQIKATHNHTPQRPPVLPPSPHAPARPHDVINRCLSVRLIRHTNCHIWHIKTHQDAFNRCIRLKLLTFSAPLPLSPRRQRLRTFRRSTRSAFFFPSRYPLKHTITDHHQNLAPFLYESRYERVVVTPTTPTGTAAPRSAPTAVRQYPEFR